MFETLAQRIAWLVETMDGGNMAKAVRSISASPNGTQILQSTLARIRDGVIKNPRADTLSAIADHYGVSVDWLLNGQNAPPMRQIIENSIDNFDTLLTSLGFPNSIAAGVLACTIPLVQVVSFVERGGSLGGVLPEQDNPTSAIAIRAIGEHLAVWTKLIMDLSDVLGSEGLMKALSTPEAVEWFNRLVSIELSVSDLRRHHSAASLADAQALQPNTATMQPLPKAQRGGQNQTKPILRKRRKSR